jgi:hypothetical protein
MYEVVVYLSSSFWSKTLNHNLWFTFPGFPLSGLRTLSVWSHGLAGKASFATFPTASPHE